MQPRLRTYVRPSLGRRGHLCPVKQPVATGTSGHSYRLWPAKIKGRKCNYIMCALDSPGLIQPSTYFFGFFRQPVRAESAAKSGLYPQVPRAITPPKGPLLHLFYFSCVV
jgi:hypothetical protein